MPRPSRARSEDGFTLLEVVVAMGILGGGLLALGAAQLSAMQMAARAKNLMEAIHLAQQQIETFQVMPAPSLPASGADPLNPIDPDPADGDLTVFNRRWTIAANSPTAGITSITVSVDWFDPKVGVTRTTSIQTLRGS